MNKEKFLSSLGEALQGRVSSQVYNETLNYYEEYIATKVREGYSEEEVLEELGDPRLLARTLIDEFERNGFVPNESNGKEADAEEEDARKSLGKVIAVINGILIVVILAVLTGSVIKILLPLIVIAVVAYIIYKYFIYKK